MTPLRNQILTKAWAFFPAFTVVVCHLLTHISSALLGSYALFPDLTLLAILFWCCVRPGHMSYGMCFLLGLYVDIATYSPALGLNALLFLGARALLLNFKKEIEEGNFIHRWVVLGIVVVCAVLAKILFIYLRTEHLPSLAGAVGDIFITLLAYPCLHAALIRAEAWVYKRVWFALHT